MQSLFLKTVYGRGEGEIIPRFDVPVPVWRRERGYIPLSFR